MKKGIGYTYSSHPHDGAFTVKTLQTGKDWLNMLWNRSGYQTVVTHTGTTTACRVTEAGECIRLNAQKSTFLYVRDAASGKYFSPGGYPCGSKVQGYACTHGQLLSTVTGRKYGLEVQLGIAVHPQKLCELWRVQITNKSKTAKTADVFACTEFDLGGYPMPFYYNAPTTSATCYQKECNAVVCYSQNPYGGMQEKSGFISCKTPPDYVCGNIDDFTGVCAGYSVPRTLAEKQHLSGSMATVRSRGGITEHCLTLAAGESKTLYYALGFIRDESDLISLVKEVFGTIETFFADLPQASRRENADLTTHSQYKQINAVLNYWVQKQVRYCCIGKKAVRDNSQLAVALLDFDPAYAKDVLAECLRHQYADGHAALLWYPVVETKTYSDPAFWLICAVAEYIKETGDTAFLQENVPYLDGGSGSVLAHIAAGVAWYCDSANYGEHGLFKIYTADWNDALNIPDENAESVFMSECVCYLFGQMHELYTHLGDAEKAAEMSRRKDALAQVINNVAYNGEYYIRALSKLGKVGDKGCEGGAFYFNTQSWAALAGIIPQDRLQSVTAAMDRYETEQGVPMCVPPYPRYDERVGRMSGMLPGVYENGGIYNHAGCFKVMADCALGRNEHALATLLKILPDSLHNPSSHSDLEPYVFSNCYLKHPAVDGKVASSWQTGTSAWGLRCYYDGILGLHRTYDGLFVAPCLPADSGTITATRPYRGCVLKLTYRNAGGKNIRVYLDGKPIENNLITPKMLAGNTEHEITVVGEGGAD